VMAKAKWSGGVRERLGGLGDELLGGGDRGQRRDGTLLGGADGAAGVGELERLTELLLVLKKAMMVA
jgi:hypothetical protein